MNTTVVISCAGVGNRLGLGVTKALIQLDGKPLIIRQLEMLMDVEDIRIVVGYQAQALIDTVLAFRRDILFVCNHNYRGTGTGGSFTLAKKHSAEYIVSLDGDLLVHPDDLGMFIALDGEWVGGVPISTDEPMLLDTEEQDGQLLARGFSYERGQYEWSGLMKAKASRLPDGEKHVCDLLRPLLPLPVKMIRAKEIDTMQDYQNALAWVKNGYCEQ